MEKTYLPYRSYVKLQMLCLFSALILISACRRGVYYEDNIGQESEMELKSASLTDVSSSYGIHQYTKLFDGGNEGYHSFRLPSIVKSPNGTLIAFAEGRKDSDDDWGDINLVYKRSTDNGLTWSSLYVLEGMGPGKFGNPTAVTDFETGKVWIFFLWNDSTHTTRNSFTEWGDRRTFVKYSSDNGQTWSTKQDITSSVLPTGFDFDILGPGVGIQCQQAHEGRLIIPALKRNIYSDDNGSTWSYELLPDTITSESTIVERYDGSLFRNDRSISDFYNYRRKIASGTIENGFTNFSDHSALLCPRCEGSTLRYTFSAVDRILFMNPSSTVTRTRMFVKISYDGGITWPIAKRIHDWLTQDQATAQGKGGYSSMTKTADNKIGALIEENPGDGHHDIEFHRFSLSWILNGNNEP